MTLTKDGIASIAFRITRAKLIMVSSTVLRRNDPSRIDYTVH